MNTIPFIDPDVKFVGASKLRDLSAAKLRKLEDTIVIQDNDNRLAVILSYDRYLAIQNELLSAVNTVELLSEKNEIEGIVTGLNDVVAGRTRSFAEIKARLRRKYGQAQRPEEEK